MDSHHQHAPDSGRGHAGRHTGSAGDGRARRPGRRRVPRHRQRTDWLRRALPSAPVVAGLAALCVAVGGAADTADAGPAGSATDGNRGPVASASARTDTPADAGPPPVADRRRTVSRDARRAAPEQTTSEQLQARAEAQAKKRDAALARLARQAERQADKIARNRWVLPLSDYRLTAGFGASSGLWAHSHTGLDFAAPSGTPIVAVAAGTVTQAASDGAYGNKLVVTLPDGTELWFAHQRQFAVSVGEQVAPGEVIGYVGSTGNTTGPHLHLEVRPGAGDPVDPRAALAEHGLAP